MGDTALGIITSAHYDYNLNTQRNKDFVAAFNAMHKRNPDFFAVQALRRHAPDLRDAEEDRAATPTATP